MLQGAAFGVERERESSSCSLSSLAVESFLTTRKCINQRTAPKAANLLEKGSLLHYMRVLHEQERFPENGGSAPFSVLPGSWMVGVSNGLAGLLSDEKGLLIDISTKLTQSDTLRRDLQGGVLSAAQPRVTLTETELGRSAATPDTLLRPFMRTYIKLGSISHLQHASIISMSGHGHA